MTNYTKKSFSSRRRDPIDYDLFIGGETKTADFTIFYNVALDNILKVKDRKKTYLAEYLWKASKQRKNSDGYQITAQDERIIDALIVKVDAIRNYHSHIWHDNSVLRFDTELKNFVEMKYNEAKASLFAEYPGALTEYEKSQKAYKGKFDLFKEVNKTHFITTEGRIFFLSFFLSTGQMSQFLQQRKGNKRNDMPEYKIKRLLYTFYCHRDGAAIVDFNHESRIIDQLDAEDRKHILNARTAFKLLTYLIDYPHYWGNKDVMPIVSKDGTIVRNVVELKNYIEENNLLPGVSLQLMPFHDADPEAEYDEPEASKIKEDKFRLGFVKLTLVDIPDHDFEINFDSLHRLTSLQKLQVIAPAEPWPLETLKAALKKQVEKREKLQEIISKPQDTWTEEQISFLLDKENQYLRGGRQLTMLGIRFFEEVEKGIETKWRLQLANKIQSKTDDADSEAGPEPIQIHQQDFVTGTRKKFRAGQRFVFYTAKYLMDFGGDNWYWGMEKFEFVKKKPNEEAEALLKRKFYFKASEIPLNEDYRLTVENDHIYIAVIKDVQGVKNHEKFIQFAFGPNALRYLAAYIVNNEQNYTSKLEEFFDKFGKDIELLKEDMRFRADQAYDLIEAPFVSEYLKVIENPLDNIKSRITSRVAHIKQQWKDAKANLGYMSRSSKNKLVMDAYKLFDWDADRPDGKFLRENEYKQMSVCHYSLHLKAGGKTSKFRHLFENLFGLNKRQPPIPSEILQILDSAESLDELVDLVIADRKIFLNQLVERLSLPPNLLKKQLSYICGKLGISIPSSLLKDTQKQLLHEKHRHTLEVQPFVIHPMLVLKHFFPEVYFSGKEMSFSKDNAGNDIRTRPAVPVFENVRKNRQLNKVLDINLYNASIAAAFYNDGNSKLANKLKGIINTALTEDVLLWWMCQRYLQQNDYTANISEFVKSGQDINIKSLNKLSLKMALKSTDPNDTERKIIFVSVISHQLDDLMFFTERSNLRKAAIHFLRRCTIEKDIWLDNINAIEKVIGTLPDGSENNPIPFGLLKGELELVRRHGQKFAEHILAFEKTVLNSNLTNNFTGKKDKFHNWLMSNFIFEKGKLPHLNFGRFLTLQPEGNPDIDIKILDNYRNIAFHNDVPIHNEGSFAWLTREGQPIRKLLGLETDLNAKRDNSIYQIEKEIAL